MSPMVSNNSTSSSSTPALPRPIHADFDAAFSPNEMRPLALVCHETKLDEFRDFVAKYKNILKRFRLTGTQATIQCVEDIYGSEKKDVTFLRSGPYELIESMKNNEIGGAIFFRNETAPNLHVEALVRKAHVNNLLHATTPATAASVMELLKTALSGKEGKPQLLPSFFATLPKNPALEKYEQRMKNAMEEANKASSQTKMTATATKSNNKMNLPQHATPVTLEVRRQSQVSAARSA